MSYGHVFGYHRIIENCIFLSPFSHYNTEHFQAILTELAKISVFSFLSLLSFVSHKRSRPYILNSISNVYIETRVISPILNLHL